MFYGALVEEPIKVVGEADLASGRPADADRAAKARASESGVDLRGADFRITGCWPWGRRSLVDFVASEQRVEVRLRLGVGCGVDGAEVALLHPGSWVGVGRLLGWG